MKLIEIKKALEDFVPSLLISIQAKRYMSLNLHYDSDHEITRIKSSLPAERAEDLGKDYTEFGLEMEDIVAATTDWTSV